MKLQLVITASLMFISGSSIAAEIIPLTQGLTFAQRFSETGKKETLLVLADNKQVITAVNVSQQMQAYPEDPLRFLASHEPGDLLAWLNLAKRQDYHYAELLSSAGKEERQIAAGANYAEHGKEANIDEVFLFPKYSKGTAAISDVRVQPEGLLDYEVELCLRWPEKITHAEQVRSEVTAVFLCADMTDRAIMLRNLNFDHIASGHGFTDAKSGRGKFPTGPYIVVPYDLASFIKQIQLTTKLNGEMRQDSQANKMLKTPDELVRIALKSGHQPLWRYQAKEVALFNAGGIEAGQTLLTGTPEGVTFQAPSLHYKVTKGLKWIVSFAFLKQGPKAFVINEYIRESQLSQRYLQVGDKVTFSGTFLGEIEVTVKP